MLLLCILSRNIFLKQGDLFFLLQKMLDHLVNDDLSQTDNDLEGSEEELEVAGREWRRMEERSLKEGFRSDAVFPLLATVLC